MYAKAARAVPKGLPDHCFHFLDVAVVQRVSKALAIGRLADKVIA
jgi:hypothetical protein